MTTKTENPIDLAFDGKWYRGCPLPPDLKQWTDSKQDAVYRYIDFIWELKGVSRRQIINNPADERYPWHDARGHADHEHPRRGNVASEHETVLT